MYTLIVENERGEQLELTNNPNYDVLRVDGLGPPPATINMVKVAGADGSIFNSSTVEPRNIVIALNIKMPIEENRIALYKFFRAKRACKIYYKNENRNVFINGYVETFENDLFTQLQKPQISIICPKSFWNAVDELLVEFSNTVSTFEFPFSITDSGIEFSTIKHLTTKYVDVGEIETGGIIELHAISDQILNPTFYNRTTQTFFSLNVDMIEGDIIIINTQIGEKSITLIRDGVSTNILSKRRTGSTWITFEPGENEISYDADEGVNNLNVKLIITKKYEGV